jgi:hypothetical protein
MLIAEISNNQQVAPTEFKNVFPVIPTNITNINTFTGAIFMIWEVIKARSEARQKKKRLQNNV